MDANGRSVIDVVFYEYDGSVSVVIQPDAGPLLAAAPDLLAACDALVAHDKNGRFGKPSFPEAIEQARLAIAKVKGELNAKDD